ncbi:MAG TPA: hypothetical protein DCE41_22990 [Cytophagales bacterium]|nr:hypothetical protein [Cytophagales bacterium]HAA22059.1 hypothetical protein [Cytophagales bacterium]HAP60807.1 hypothetical protein [Cytophagales bacterium]
MNSLCKLAPGALLVLLFYSCSPSVSKQLVGTWETDGLQSGISSQATLKDDHSFVQELEYNNQKWTTAGHWEVNEEKTHVVFTIDEVSNTELDRAGRVSTAEIKVLNATELQLVYGDGHKTTWARK